MPQSSRSAQAMVNALLTYDNIDASTATEAQRATYLGYINEAYREYLRGVWRDERGEEHLHVWSFLHVEDDLAWAVGQGQTYPPATADAPADFGGTIEDLTFQYGASKASLNIRRITPEKMRHKNRDWSGDRGTPAFWCLRAKELTAANGSEYEFELHPSPDAAVTLTLRYLADPADLTDSATNYPAGNTGCERVIVAIGKGHQEPKNAQVLGPETRKAVDLMRAAVMQDTNLFPTESQQESYAEVDGGLGA